MKTRPAAAALVAALLLLGERAAGGACDYGSYSIELIRKGGSRPGWAPDGRAIAFQNQGDPTRGIPRDGTHGFSPDDRFILFTSTRDGSLDGEIYVMNLATRATTRLTADPAWDEHAHFSPDGAKISWISGRDNLLGDNRYTGLGLPPLADFALIVPATATTNPSLPDELRLQTDLYLMNADGTGVERLTTFVDRGGLLADNDWSPDGGRIAFFGSETKGEGPSLFVLRFVCN